ncbi:MAG TPA: DUF4349 domain-containing protein [Candidatus Acidoferrales bacterium]|nr:DUF4349 domain-containing protein [Candidatus Acidoferrales bacterium]
MESTTHPFDREEVMAYLDGELAPERAAAAAAHLEQCADCRALAASLRSLSSQLPQWEVEMIPAAVEQNVLRAANEKAVEPSALRSGLTAQKRQPVRWLLWGSALSAALLLILVSLPTLNRSTQRAEVAMRQTGLSAPMPVRPPAAPPPRNFSIEGQPAADQALAENRALSPPVAAMKKWQATQNAVQGQRSEPAKQSGPMIVRTASLAVLTKEFDAARAALENLVKAHQGYFGQLNIAAPASAGRTLTATVRVPAAQLDAVLVELRKLGHVEQENQSADDVTRQYVDLVARLNNARETEKRLVEILRERTGKVSDVLEVEEQIARTREQIEQMDAERKTLEGQVQYASVDLRITEEYKQSLETPAPSLGTRLNNAAVSGLRDAADLLIGLVLWLLGNVPSLAVLAAILAWPVLRLVRWLRRRFASAPVPAAQ